LTKPEARHFVGFHLKALDHHVLDTGDRLNVQMIGQRLKTLHQKAQEPFEPDPHHATNASQRNPLYQQAFDESPSVVRNTILLQALDKLASTVMTVMVLFSVVNVTVFFVLGGLTPRADVSHDHSLLLTSAG
jgi:hypothetical protein